MADIILVLKQQGIIRASGYQVTQWCVTQGATSTTPSSFAGLFLVRNVLGIESFERVASLTDYAAYQERDAIYFEPRGSTGDQFLSQVQANDTLVFPGPETLFWEQTDSPYNDREFTVNNAVNRAAGSAPAFFTPQQLQLPGYSFTDEDIGRWVLLSGFSASALNGYAQILSYTGNTATINLGYFENQVGGTWAFPRAEIKTFPGGPQEPRWFPSIIRDAAWQHKRGGSVLSSDSNGGGFTSREDPDRPLVRTARWSDVLPTQQAALDFMSVVRTGVAQLQRDASVSNTTFQVVIQTVFGP